MTTKSQSRGNLFKRNLSQTRFELITIGIHPHPKDPEKYHEKWASFLAKKGVSVQWVNLLAENALDQARKCNGIMWRWLHNWQDKQSARLILQTIENYLKIPVFPEQKTSWHYDEKVSQLYLLSAIEAPIPKTWVFWDQQEAITWVHSAQYPLVFKLSVGAGSANILIVQTVGEAIALINNAFNGGIFPYTMNEFHTSIAGPRAPHWKPEFDHVYFQEFLPGNDFDTRITIIGNRAFGFRRFNRPCDFRASGSGLIDYSKDKIDLNCVKIAFDISDRCSFTSMAYDFLYKEGSPVVCEISYTFNDEAIYNCPGYWNKDLVWTEVNMWPEQAQAEDFLKRVKHTISKKTLNKKYCNIGNISSTLLVQNNAKPVRVLIFYDEKGWAWWHRSHNIKSNISSQFYIDIKKIGSPFNTLDYDIILLFETYMYEQIYNVPPEKVIVGSSTLKTLPSALNDFISNNFAALVVNNKEAFDNSKNISGIYCCQNGVDEALFYYKYPRNEDFTACWVGNNSSINNKGLDIIKDACKVTGIKLLLLDQTENVYKGNLITQAEVRDTIYHNSSCYICASEMEGTPNPALEALACGLPVISTRVGNMPEIIVDGYNGYLIERTLEDIVKAINTLKTANLEEMSENARKSIINGWTWKDKINKYETMFNDVAHTIKQKSNHNVNKAQRSPLVSVILPTHNRPEMLATAISSILTQTMQSFEIIVINDAGTDVLPALEKFTGKGNIRHIVHDSNQGLAAARNTGIRAARGKYIAYLDDDDIFYPNHLETLTGFLESHDCRVAYTDANRALQHKTVDGFVTVKREVLHSRDFNYDAILVDNFIPVLCVMHEKDCLSLSGMFDESLPRHEDWDLWIRMSRQERFSHLPAVTCEFTYRPDSSGMTSSTLPLFLKTHTAVCRKHKGLAANKPLVQSNQLTILFDTTFRAFQFLGERLEPYLTNSSVTGEMLAEITPSGASLSQIKSSFIWRKATSMADTAAISSLEIALTIDGENHPARIALCERYLKTGRHADALRHMEFLALANPNESEFIKTRDTLNRHIGTVAPQTGSQGLASDSVQPCDNRVRPVSVYSLDERDEACSRVRLLSPFDAIQEKTMNFDQNRFHQSEASRTRYERLKIQLEVLPLDESLRTVENFLKESPNFAEAHNDLGVLYFKEGNKLQALGHYEKAVRLSPLNSTFRKNLASFYFVEMGWTDDAIAIYTDILTSHPSDIDVLTALGIISNAIGRPEEAGIFFRRIIEMEPWNVEVRNALTSLDPLSATRLETLPSEPIEIPVPSRMSEIDDILASLRKPTPPTEDSPDELYRKALKLANDGFIEQAIADLHRLLLQDTDNALIHNDLAVLYSQTGDAANALFYQEKAVNLAPYNSTFQKNLAGLYYSSGNRIDDAIALYTRLLRENSDDVEILGALAIISMENLRPDDAMRFLDKIIELEPGNGDARQLREQIIAGDTKDFFLSAG
jgi:tetratricopeptide (TPR) repeat protein/glycosyltransferase involved in cell wall biosynthesis